MRLLSIAALAIGLVRTQQVDLNALGVNPAQILASDPEVDALLAEYESSMISGRSLGDPTSIMEMFGVRQLPPGIELAQFINNGQFDTAAFLDALKQALTDQALASSQSATQAPVAKEVVQEVVAQPVLSNPVANNRPIEVSSNEELRNVMAGNRPQTTDEPSSSNLKVFYSGSNYYDSCRYCNGQTASQCQGQPVISCGFSDNYPFSTKVCHYTIRQRFGQEPKYYSRCVERDACMAQVRQNFVANINGEHPMNRCKGSIMMTSAARFRPYSQCDFCMRMTQSSFDDDNKIFRYSGQIVPGVTVSQALTDPWSYFASTTGSPYSQIFDLTQYN